MEKAVRESCMIQVKALVLTGFGLNCDYETDYSLKLAGAEPYRVHINELIFGKSRNGALALRDFHILVFATSFQHLENPRFS